MHARKVAVSGAALALAGTLGGLAAATGAGAAQGTGGPALTIPGNGFPSTALPCDGTAVQAEGYTLTCSGPGAGSVTASYTIVRRQRRKPRHEVAVTAAATGGASVGGAGVSFAGDTVTDHLALTVPGATGQDVTVTITVTGPAGEAVTAVAARPPGTDGVVWRQDFGQVQAVKH